MKRPASCFPFPPPFPAKLYAQRRFPIRARTEILPPIPGARSTMCSACWPTSRNQWASTCLPAFCIVGAPRSGSRRLLQAITHHPEVVTPLRKSLQFFSASGRVQEYLRELNWTWYNPMTANGSTVANMRLRRLYANSFPSIDPRDFKLTGEASVSYLYSAAAPSFFAHPHFALIRLILLLRQPTSRSLAELGGRSRDDKTEGQFAALRAAQDVCGASALYKACSECPPQSIRRDRPASCTLLPLVLQNATHEWRALWRSWYHLFLPRWLSLQHRVLVMYFDDLQPPTVHHSLKRVAQFLRLIPATLSTPSGVDPVDLAPDLPVASPTAAFAHQFNASKEVISSLRALTADSVVQSDSLMRAAGRMGVPRAWHP